MRLYVINGRLYKIEQDEDDYDSDSPISEAALREMARFASFIISYDYECDDYWTLRKNRYSGEHLEFNNFDDALEYCQMVWPETQRHKGMLSLNSTEDVVSLIKRISPLAGSRFIEE